MHKRSRIPGYLDIFRRTDVNYWISHEHRLIYLSIPKNANSFLRSLFLHNHPLAADYDADRESAMQYHRRTGSRGIALRHGRVGHYPGYTKFVALRDPMARAVSAYLDKIVKKIARRDADRPGRRFYREVSRVTGRRVTEQTLRFADFLEYIVACPDFRRNKHYKSQRYFTAGRHFDFYGDIEHMSEIMDFLVHKGFDIRGFATRAPKRTAYAEPGSHAVVSAARATTTELNAHASYPSFADFFDETLLQHFLRAYRQDLALYCRARGQRADAVLARYRHGDRARNVSGSHRASRAIASRVASFNP